MKTYSELIEALCIVSDEATKSGFTFCAAIAAPSPEPVTTIFCGESLEILGLAEVIKINLFEKNRHKTY